MDRQIKKYYIKLIQIIQTSIKYELAKNTTLIPSPTNLELPKTKTSQKHSSSDTSIHASKKSSYERKIVLLGNNNTNILNMKNKVLNKYHSPTII